VLGSFPLILVEQRVPVGPEQHYLIVHPCYKSLVLILTWHDLHFVVPCIISARAEEPFLRLVPDPRMDGEWPVLISGHILPEHLYLL
jgi:hypothetical protein